jgi:hypothetical protein
MSLHPGLDARMFCISILRVTYEVRKFPDVFLVVVLKIQMVFDSYIYKTKLTLELKRKYLKDILRSVKFILVLCLHHKFKKYRFYTGVSRAYLHVVFLCIFVTLNKSI